MIAVKVRKANSVTAEIVGMDKASIKDCFVFYGGTGRSAYEEALANGFEGTPQEWLDSLAGEDGKSAFEIAVDNGFKGTQREWIESLAGKDGKSGFSPVVEVEEIEGGSQVSITDSFGTMYIDIMNGEDGKDGISPKVDVTEIENGHRVTITDTEGTESFDVMNGAGGKNAEDGFSPTVNVADIEGGHRITITDIEGVKSFDVMDGEEVTEEKIIKLLGYTPAPAGFGYGDKMQWLNFDEVTWKTTGTFQADLEAVFESMPQGTSKQVQLIDPDGLNGQKFYGEIWKYTNNYGVITAVNYSGLKAVKTFYNNVWQPWEWVNPPMEDGVEYRTTERIDGKPVYKQYGSLGALPNASTLAFAVSVSGAKLDKAKLTVEAYNSSNRRYTFPFINTDGAIRAIVYATGARTYTIKSFSDLSDYSASYFIEFTKQ